MSSGYVALSDAQRRLLDAMGVDVWIRRGVGVADPRSSVEPTSVQEPSAAPQHDVTRRPDPPITTRSDLKVSLDCISGVGAVVVGDFSNTLDRRLAQDILLSIVGITAELQQAQFRWPQTQTGDSSAHAARNAYQGFLRGQVERARAEWLLLFGSSAELLFNTESFIGETPILRLPDVRALRADPAAKRRLWLNVSRRDPG